MHSSLEGSEFQVLSQEPIRFYGYEFFPGPLKPDAVIARWNVTPYAGGLAEIPPSTSLGVSHFRAPIKRDEA